jgi:hypothetical protein
MDINETKEMYADVCRCCGVYAPFESFEAWEHLGMCIKCTEIFTKDPLTNAETRKLESTVWKNGVQVTGLKEPLHIAQMRKIVKEKQAAGVMCPVRKKRMMCDMFTASAIVALWDAIKNQDTKERAAKVSLLKLSSIAFKVCK